MVPIQAGSFNMGSPEAERGRYEAEGPVTHVVLTRDFYMGKYPVTQGQWEAVMGQGNWPGMGQDFPSETYGRSDDHPMYLVNWNETQNFIMTLNSHIAFTGQGPLAMRLPSEAEWEYAARAGTTTRFFFGDSLGCDDELEDCEAGSSPGYRSDYMYWATNSNGTSQPVGQRWPNGNSLHDVHGNVWEWVQDSFDYYPGGSVTDPVKPPPGPDSYAVFRGGSWLSQAGSCRSASRSSCPPLWRFPSLGFRLAANI